METGVEGSPGRVTAISSFNKFNIFVANVANGKMNLGSDVLKIMLTNSAPIATNALLSDLTEIAAANGYSTGGATVTITTSAQTSGTYKLIGNNVVFTASGGSFGPFRYAVIYDSTPTTPLKPLIGWWDYGSSISLNDTETFTVTLDQSAGILQLA